MLGSAVDHDVIDEPALEPAAPGPDVDLDAVLLHVGAGGQDQPALGHRADRPALAPLVEPLPVRRLAGLDPGLAEHGVRKLRFASSVALRRLPRPGDPLPAENQPDRRVERREVEADRRRDRPRSRSAATRRPASIAVLWCSAIRPSQRLACIRRGLGLALLPAQPLELQPLHGLRSAGRHEVAPLVGGLVLALDPREAVDRRGRGEEHLAPLREGQRPRLGERDRIAFLVGRGRIGVDLVEEEVARRHRAQADRRCWRRS